MPYDIEFNDAARPAEYVPPDPAIATFHRGLTDYSATPLVRSDAIADALGVRTAWIKDETRRLGLPAFKILGVSWAVHRVRRTVQGRPVHPDDVAALRDHLPLRPVETLVAATAGNHGRAVARAAATFDMSSRVFLPASTPPGRIEAIASEGAQVTPVDGTFDDAVRAAFGFVEARDDAILVSDTAWDGYETIPAWIIEGYSTMFWEIDQQFARLEVRPDLVPVQIGVGALAAAMTRWAASSDGAVQVVGVETLEAACMLRSVRGGRRVVAPGPHTSRMVGMNAGEPSILAWPEIERLIRTFVATDDARLDEALDLLANAGVDAGATGAGGLVGLLELRDAPPSVRQRAGLDRDANVLLLCTEGRTTDASA